VRRRGNIARPIAASATMGAMIHSRISLIASLADNKAASRVGRAATTMIRVRRVRSAVPEAAVDDSVAGFRRNPERERLHHNQLPRSG